MALEQGKGTSSVDGAALLLAGIQYILDKGLSKESSLSGIDSGESESKPDGQIAPATRGLGDGQLEQRSTSGTSQQLGDSDFLEPRSRLQVEASTVPDSDSMRKAVVPKVQPETCLPPVGS